MKVIETDVPGCLVFEPRVLSDDRGFFFEAFNLDKLAKQSFAPDFVQGNVSSSRQGVLRGLHYQWPKPQGKLVSALSGEVWDVAVDIRRGSPTFGRSTAVLLSGENKRQLWVPEGFAHGFVALSEDSVVTYLCTATYDPAADASVRWDDPQLAIDWPIRNVQLSDKDGRAPLLADIAAERLPVYSPASA